MISLDALRCIADFGGPGSRPAEFVRRVRDLLVLRVGDDGLLVLSCDSNASVGDKPHDVLARAPEEAGYAAAKVALMEVLAAGATPLIVADNLCVELEPTGRRVIDGIRAACAELQAGPVLTGSSETNLPTTQTGIGVTVLGYVAAARCLLGGSQPGDVVIAAGRPRGGHRDPYAETDPDVAGIGTVRRLAGRPGTHEIVPVGSRGIAAELADLSGTAGLTLTLASAHGLDLRRSGGTSTVVLAAVAPDAVPEPADLDGLPVAVIGVLTLKG